MIFIGGVQVGQAQNTIHVPGDVPSIQLAIFSANNGDTIVVAPGTYFESINFFGKAVTIVSSDGPAVTTINANGGTAVAFEQFEGNGSVLRGFTITGATNGGVVATFASPIIEKNIITGNTGCGSGAGIAVSSSAAIVRNNVITNNQGFCSTPGAGIWVQGTPPGTDNPRILNNTITLNQTDGNGAGIALLGANAPLISGNTILNNTSTNGFGGGIYVSSDNTQPVIIGNVIASNQASSLPPIPEAAAT